MNFSIVLLTLLNVVSAHAFTTPADSLQLGRSRTSTALEADVSGTPTDRSRADELFETYDVDGNGLIDRDEFDAIVSKMNSSSRRREFISVLTAGLGSLVVATEKNTFAFGQKTLRSKYLEPLAESKQNQLFPTALLSSDLDDSIWRTLKARGFSPQNTLFGHSVCADEVNMRKEQTIDLMTSRWEEAFTLGGLAGLPFAGKSGFGAYLHHVPDDGKLLILFAPHVGIDEEGRVGSLQRDGQAAVSTACGAAIGAYKELQKRGKTKEDDLVVFQQENSRQFDPQLKEIIALLAPRLKGIENSEDSIAFITYQMYGIIRELIQSCIVDTKDLFDSASEVAVVGGIMVNRRKGGDFFQPLSFESLRREQSAPDDLFEEAFGKKPDLLKVMGSQEAIDRALLG